MHRVDGMIVHATASYMGVPRQDRAHLLVRILLWTFALFIVLPIVIAVWVMRDILSSGSKTSSDHGLVEQVLGYWFGIKLWDRSRTPIRDFRVRESGTGRVWLVRMYGQLSEGDMARGDAVTIFADDANGTLIFRSGYNHSLLSSVNVI